MANLDPISLIYLLIFISLPRCNWPSVSATAVNTLHSPHLGSGSLHGLPLPGCRPHPAWFWQSPTCPHSHLSAWDLITRLTILHRVTPYTCWTQMPHPMGLEHAMLSCLSAETRPQPAQMPAPTASDQSASPSPLTFLTLSGLMALALNCLGREEEEAAF